MTEQFRPEPKEAASFKAPEPIGPQVNGHTHPPEVTVELVTVKIKEEGLHQKTKGQEFATMLFATDFEPEAPKEDGKKNVADTLRQWDAQFRPGKKDHGRFRDRPVRMAANFGVGAVALAVDPLNDFIEEKILDPKKPKEDLHDGIHDGKKGIKAKLSDGAKKAAESARETAHELGEVYNLKEVFRQKPSPSDTELVKMDWEKYFNEYKKNPEVIEKIKKGEITAEMAWNQRLEELDDRNLRMTHEMNQALQFGVALQEFGVDWLIEQGANKALSKMTGEHIHYPSEVSEFVSMPLQYIDKVKMYANPVNIEAAWRVVTDIPFVGIPFDWAYEGGNTVLEMMDEHKMTRTMKAFLVGRTKDAMKAAIKGLTKDKVSKYRTRVHIDYEKTMDAIKAIGPKVSESDVSI